MIFMSKAKRLRVILKPSFHVIDANGQRVLIPGKTIEFANGRYETQDPDEISALLKHSLFNAKFVAVEDEQAWKEEHPEYFQPPVNMITGAMSTIFSAPSPLVEASQMGLRNSQQTAAPIDIDKIIEEKIAEKFGALSSKLDRLLNVVNDTSITPPKAKKTFKCPVPGCDFVGRTGIEVGAHKKAVHGA